MRRVVLAMVALAFGFAAGCGGGQHDPANPPAAPVNKIKEVRDSLASPAKTGELNSGVTTLPERIDALAAEGVANTAALHDLAVKLRAAKGPGEVKKLAAELLKKLPPAPVR